MRGIMSEDHKARAMAALLKHHKKDAEEIAKLNRPKKKNKKPEKLVEAECLFWMRQQRWSVNIFESKATYDPRRGVYRNQSMSAGVCDCIGTLPNGIAVYVEFKSPGKLNTFNRKGNERQVEYINSKIHMNAFAIVTDSVERLQEIYEEWSERREISLEFAREYLISQLP
jgi:hypothetical protein